MSDFRNIKGAVFDMDGTIYLGNRVFPFAIRFINALRGSGRRVLFFTNNASHTAEFYMKKLGAMGFCPSRSEIMTSGDVTAEFLLRHRPGGDSNRGQALVLSILAGRESLSQRELTELIIDPEAVDPEDVEMLQDMIIAAVNAAIRDAEKTSAESMSKITGGMNFGF